MKTASLSPAPKASRKLTRDQLLELEQKEKTSAQKLADTAITLLPVVSGLAAMLEYALLPNAFANPRPATYFVFLLILFCLYTGALGVGLVQLTKGNKHLMQRLRHKAPLYTLLFLLLLVYDFLTLKTAILLQPFLPCVNSIFNIVWDDREYLIISALYSLRLLFFGYFIGVITGLVTGIACGYSPKVRYWVDPVIKFLGPIPSSTWIPIMMVLVSGHFFGASVFIIALGVWFAVTVASMTGISNVDKEYFEAAKTLGASEQQLVFRVAIPHAMPSILQGMTQGMSTACTALMIAEMMGVEAGLGWYITWAKAWASYNKMFAALIVICLLFTAVTKVLNMVKKRVLRWQIGVVK